MNSRMTFEQELRRESARFITRRWGLETLPGIRMRDEGLARNGSAPMGDLTQALDFAQTPR